MRDAEKISFDPTRFQELDYGFNKESVVLEVSLYLCETYFQKLIESQKLS